MPCSEFSVQLSCSISLCNSCQCCRILFLILAFFSDLDHDGKVTKEEVVSCLSLIQKILSDSNSDPARTLKDVSEGVFRIFDLDNDESITVLELRKTFDELMGIIFGLVHELVAQLKSIASNDLIQEMVNTICKNICPQQGQDFVAISLQEVLAYAKCNVDTQQLFEIMQYLKSMVEIPDEISQHSDTANFLNSANIKIKATLLSLGTKAIHQSVSKSDCIEILANGAKQILALSQPVLSLLEMKAVTYVLSDAKRELDEKGQDLLWNEIMRAILRCDEEIKKVFGVCTSGLLEIVNEDVIRSYLEAVVGLIDPKADECLETSRVDSLKKILEELFWAEHSETFQNQLEKLLELILTTVLSKGDEGSEMLNSEDLRAIFLQIVKTTFSSMETTTKVFENMVAKALEPMFHFLVTIKFYILGGSQDKIELSDIAKLGQKILEN